MKYGNGKRAVAVLVLALGTVTIWADGFRNPPPTAAGLGRGGANTAGVQGPSAVFYNPAALGEMSEPAAEVGLDLARTKTDYHSPAGRASSDDPWQTLPALFAAWPVTDTGWTAGLGVTLPYGQSAEWDKDSLFRYTAPYYARMTVVNVNPSVGVRVNDRLLVGGGIDVLFSTFEFKQVYPWAMATGVAGLPDGRAKFDSDGTGVGGNLGLAWDAAPGQRLALTYRSAVQIDYDGDFKLSGIPPSPAFAAFRSSSDFSTRITFPDIVAAAWGAQLAEGLRVEAQVEWLNWSRYDQLDLDVGRNQPLLPQDSIRNDWDDTWTFALGADWQYAPGWTARAGYAYLQSPVPDDTYSPILPDADRQVLSLGLGYAHGRHQVDLAASFSFYEDRDIRNNQNPAYNGTYETESDLVGLTYSCAF